MKLLKTLPLALLVGFAVPALADFTQADLEKIVTELDRVIPENKAFKYPIKCSIVDENQVNAYATLTKEGTDYRATMVVYSGLVKQIAGSERLIRAVVAHELSHLSLGHHLDLDPAARDLKNLWVRQQEYEADKFGAVALEKCGHSKQDMVDMLLFLDGRRSRTGDWLGRLTADHADPKARAAEVSADPNALRALVNFDTGLAYEDARNHYYAKLLFDLAASQWSALTVANVNSAHCALLDYYDNLSLGVRTAWWRPDFGPMIVSTPRIGSRGPNVITDEDRDRWKDAASAAELAIAKNPGNLAAEEMRALSQVLEPDGKKEVVQKGIDWFDAHVKSATDEPSKLRYANNAGVGYQRLGDLQKAYTSIMAAQKGTTLFNSALGENLGLVKVTGRSKEDDTLAANVLFTWLNNTPSTSTRWPTVKKTFDEVCKTAGITPKAIEQAPAYLCSVTTLVTSNKELGILLPVESMSQLLGTPEERVTFVEKYPDLCELRWNKGAVSMFCERNKVMRITSYEPGAHLLLKPLDPTSNTSIKVQVGMKADDLWAQINPKAGEDKDLAKGGKVEKWTYFSALNMGVLIEAGVVKGITVTPVVYEEG